MWAAAEGLIGSRELTPRLPRHGGGAVKEQEDVHLRFRAWNPAPDLWVLERSSPRRSGAFNVLETLPYPSSAPVLQALGTHITLATEPGTNSQVPPRRKASRSFRLLRSKTPFDLGRLRTGCTFVRWRQDRLLNLEGHEGANKGMPETTRQALSVSEIKGQKPWGLWEKANGRRVR